MTAASCVTRVVTDEEWAHIAPLIAPAKRGGRKRSVDVREVVNGLMYILSNAAKLSNNVGLPRFEYFDLWDYDGTLDRIFCFS